MTVRGLNHDALTRWVARYVGGEVSASMPNLMTGCAEEPFASAISWASLTRGFFSSSSDVTSYGEVGQERTTENDVLVGNPGFWSPTSRGEQEEKFFADEHAWCPIFLASCG